MLTSIPVAFIMMITRDYSWQSSMRVTCSSRLSVGVLLFHSPRHLVTRNYNNKRTYSHSNLPLRCSASANNESSTSPASNTGVHSARELLRLSRENQLRRTITTAATSSIISNINQQQCFTWPQLLELFRMEIRPDNSTTKSTNLQNDIHYISSNHPNLALFRRADNIQQLYEEHKRYLSDCWVSAYDYLLVHKFGNKFGFEKVVLSSVNSRNECDPEEGDNILPNDCQIIYQANLSLSQASKDTREKQLSYLSLVPNDFPYHVNTNIEHWCLWKIGKIYNSSSMEGNSISMVELSWAMDELKTSCMNSVSSCIIHNNQNIYPTKMHTSTVVDDASDITIQSLIIGISGKENDYLKKTSHPPPPVNNITVLDMLYWINPPHLQSMPEMHHAHILVLRS